MLRRLLPIFFIVILLLHIHHIYGDKPNNRDTTLLSLLKEGSWFRYEGTINAISESNDVFNETSQIISGKIYLNVSVERNFVDWVELKIEYLLDIPSYKHISGRGDILINISRYTETFQFKGLYLPFPISISPDSLGNETHFSLSINSSGLYRAANLSYNYTVSRVDKGPFIGKLFPPPYKLISILVLIDIEAVDRDGRRNIIEDFLYLQVDSTTGVIVRYSGIFYPILLDGYKVFLSSMNLVDTNIELSRPPLLTWDYIVYYKYVYEEIAGRNLGWPAAFLIHQIHIIIFILSISTGLILVRRFRRYKNHL